MPSATARDFQSGASTQALANLDGNAGDFFGDGCECGLALRTAGKWPAILRPNEHLLEPGDAAPATGQSDNGEDSQAVLPPPLQQPRHLLAQDELRGQEIGGDKQDGDVSLIDLRFDLGEPIVAGCDAGIVLHVFEDAFDLEHPEMGDQPVLDPGLLMAVADEDDGLAHTRNRRYHK